VCVYKKRGSKCVCVCVCVCERARRRERRKCLRNSSCSILFLCSNKHLFFLTHADLVCSLPVDVGECFAMHLQYYYSVEEKTCRLFHYGGCKGNGNRFETRDECLKML